MNLFLLNEIFLKKVLIPNWKLKYFWMPRAARDSRSQRTNWFGSLMLCFCFIFMNVYYVFMFPSWLHNGAQDLLVVVKRKRKKYDFFGRVNGQKFILLLQLQSVVKNQLLCFLMNIEIFLCKSYYLFMCMCSCPCTFL